MSNHYICSPPYSLAPINVTTHWLKLETWSHSSHLTPGPPATVVSSICKHVLTPSIFLSFCSHHHLPSHLHFFAWSTPRPPNWLPLNLLSSNLCSRRCLKCMYTLNYVTHLLNTLDLPIELGMKISPSSHGLPHSLGI